MTLRIEETRDIAACRALRRAVFIEEQGVSEQDEIDDLDDVAHHLIATVDGTPVASARIVIKGRDAKIGRVCVLQSHRGKGLGAKLIEAGIDLLEPMPHVSRAVLGAQTHALGFYEKLGFCRFGPVYLDAGIDHQDMERRV